MGALFRSSSDLCLILFRVLSFICATYVEFRFQSAARPRLERLVSLALINHTLGARAGLRTNLVDPASSHMLVSKIKPCMSQYKLLYGETANGSLKQL